MFPSQKGRTMELRHITLFCLIKEHRSISKAAQMAYLSQPTVSQHLKTLESELGVSLFDRMGRQVLPTQAGEIFYRYARQVLKIIDEARNALDDYLGSVRGDLWIAGSTIPGQYILPALIGAFSTVHPEVIPHLQIGDSQWAVERVRFHEVELGFVGAFLERPGLSFQPFARDELILVVPPEHPLAKRRVLNLEELPSVPFLSREEGSGTRSSWESLMNQAGVDPIALRIVGELGSTEAIIRGVKAGLGAGIVSLRAVNEELDNGSLVRISLEGHRLERTFYVVRHMDRALSPAARTFETYVRESLADLP